MAQVLPSHLDTRIFIAILAQNCSYSILTGIVPAIWTQRLSYISTTSIVLVAAGLPFNILAQGLPLSYWHKDCPCYIGTIIALVILTQVLSLLYWHKHCPCYIDTRIVLVILTQGLSLLY